jgi:MFS transporter, FHS family, L-fucose permease
MAHRGVHMPGGLCRDAKRYPLAFALTIFLFAVWGGAHRIFGIVSPQFERFFTLSYLQSSIVFLSLNLSYFLIALPVALFLRRFGYKLGLVAGLAFFALGALVLYPAVIRHQALFHIVSVVVTGIGWAFLEVSANTLIVGMGPSATAIRRLNLAQCFYPVGLIGTTLFLREFAMPPQSAAFGQFVNDVVRPYVVGGLGALLFALVVETIEFPEVANERPPRGSRAIDDLKGLWQDSAFRCGAAVMAVYSISFSCLWGSTGLYARHVLAAPPAAGWAFFSMAAYWLFAVGRITGTALMSRIAPLHLLAGFAGFALVLCLIPATTDSMAGLTSMLGASFFLSIMFPTIFAQTIKDLGPRTTIGAGVLVGAAGLGSFVGIAALRALAGLSSVVHVNLAVAAVGFGLVLLYALTRKDVAVA